MYVIQSQIFVLYSVIIKLFNRNVLSLKKFPVLPHYAASTLFGCCHGSCQGIGIGGVIEWEALSCCIAAKRVIE